MSIGGMLARAAAMTLLAGCGAGVSLPDDLAVLRTGGSAGDRLEIVVNDSGTAACNGRAPVPISDPQLIQARYINTTIATYAKRALSLAPGSQPVFRYYVRTQDGRVSFSDDSRGAPPILSSLELLVLQIAQEDCHLAR